MIDSSRGWMSCNDKRYIIRGTWKSWGQMIDRWANWWCTSGQGKLQVMSKLEFVIIAPDLFVRDKSPRSLWQTVCTEGRGMVCTNSDVSTWSRSGKSGKKENILAKKKMYFLCCITFWVAHIDESQKSLLLLKSSTKIRPAAILWWKRLHFTC